MAKISSSEELKKKIAELELRKVRQKAEVKEHFHGMIESVKPKNLIRVGLENISEAPVLRQRLIDSVVSLATGWVAKKLAVPKNDTIIKKTAGAAIQYGVTRFMATKGDNVGDVLGRFFSNFRRRR
jgi:hypothetical protein